MAHPLNPDEAKTALAHVARGVRPRTRELAPDEAKKKLHDAARQPSLPRLATTQPLLAATIALGWGFVLGGRRRNDAIPEILEHIMFPGR